MTTFRFRALTVPETATAGAVGAFVALLTWLAQFDSAPSSAYFHPHGYCYLWQPGLVGVHVRSSGSRRTQRS